MDDSTKKIITSIFAEFFSATSNFVKSPNNFFRGIDNSSTSFRDASLFGLAVSTLLTALNVISYVFNKIPIQLLFISLDILTTWLLVLIYATSLWAISRMFRGHGEFTRSASAFFYTTLLLIPVKLLETPTRIVRDKYLSSGPLTDAMLLAIRAEINSTPYRVVAEYLVAGGYVIFLIFLIKIGRIVHGFGWARSAIVSILGLLTISLAIGYVQTPNTNLLLLAFKP